MVCIRLTCRYHGVYLSSTSHLTNYAHKISTFFLRLWVLSRYRSFFATSLSYFFNPRSTAKASTMSQSLRRFFVFVPRQRSGNPVCSAIFFASESGWCVTSAGKNRATETVKRCRRGADRSCHFWRKALSRFKSPGRCSFLGTAPLREVVTFGPRGVQSQQADAHTLSWHWPERRQAREWPVGCW